MQLSLPWRYGQTKPFGSIPQINWGHPLAQGLLFYGYDTGAGTIVDLVGSRKMNTVGTVDGTSSSVFGSGVLYNVDGTRYFNSDAAVRQSFAQVSFGCAIFQTANTAANATPFGRVAENNSSAPYVNYDFQATGPAGYGLFYGDGVSSFTGSATFSIAHNAFTSLLGVISGGGNYSYYGNGVIVTISTGVTYGNDSNLDPITFSGGSNASALNPFPGFVYYGAIWNRALSAAEALTLHQDPYCFLWYPEDTIFATLTGPAAAVVNPFIPPDFSAPKVVRARPIPAAEGQNLPLTVPQQLIGQIWLA
jgi:hypothetical protein